MDAIKFQWSNASSQKKTGNAFKRVFASRIVVSINTFIMCVRGLIGKLKICRVKCTTVCVAKFLANYETGEKSVFF